jgi:hypothetical protein
MTRKSFAQICKVNVAFQFIAAFTLAAAFATSAQETSSVPDSDRPWQHFAQSGAGEAQGSPVGGLQGDTTIFRSPASENVSFRKAVPYNTSGYNPYSVAVADLNGDGKLDLVVANEEQSKSNPQGSISVMLGKGD